MKLDCPHCGVSGSAKDSYIGQKVKCPKCNGVFEVSELETAEETTPDVKKEETLEWEDIASEMDLQDAGDEVSEQKDEGNPAELSFWEDEFEKQSDFDSNEEDIEAKDEKNRTILPEDNLETLQQDDLELQADSLQDESPLPDSAGSESVESEVNTQDYENISSDDLQLPPKEVHADDNIELDISTETQIQDSGDISSPSGQDDSGLMDDKTYKTITGFAMGNIIREAWEKTKGVKGTIWAGSAVMYLVILITVAGGAFLFPSVAGEPATLTQAIGNALFQTVADVLSILFTAGLFLMGIKRAAGEAIHWKMVFKGFSCAGKIIVTTILQFILISIGFLLLILPGIYLVVGYTMTIPLIINKGVSPWQAMEMSRKAVHKIWWKVMGIFCIMVLIFMVSFIPLGIGLIWTWPMFIILVGVIYQHLFGEEKEKRSRE
jgi:hypothetical protein